MFLASGGDSRIRLDHSPPQIAMELQFRQKMANLVFVINGYGDLGRATPPPDSRSTNGWATRIYINPAPQPGATACAIGSSPAWASGEHSNSLSFWDRIKILALTLARSILRRP